MSKLIALMLAAVLLVAPTVSAEPRVLTDSEIEQIRRNCQASQGYLQQIQRNDAVARINRGHAYESITKLVANFNSRVVLNRIDGTKLVSITSDLNKRIGAFQSDYLLYEDALSTALSIKCREQPVTFYDALSNARDLRTRVSKDINDINVYLDSYQTGLSDLKATLAQPKQETSR